MRKTSKLPRFLITANPLVGDEIYIVVTRKVVCIIRVSDMEVVLGKASKGVIQRATDWYRAYLANLKTPIS